MYTKYTCSYLHYVTRHLKFVCCTRLPIVCYTSGKNCITVLCLDKKSLTFVVCQILCVHKPYKVLSSSVTTCEFTGQCFTLAGKLSCAPDPSISTFSAEESNKLIASVLHVIVSLTEYGQKHYAILSAK